MRPKGTIVYDSALEPNPIAREAEQHQRQLQQKKQERAAADRQRRYDNAPNWICYPEMFKGRVDENGNWLGGKVPPCIKCKGLLHPNEHHVCPGYMPDLTRLNTKLTPEQRKEIRRAAWLEGDGDWDDDQYDPTTPDDRAWWEHEAETGETYDQVVLPGWDEERWMAWKRRQLGHAPDRTTTPSSSPTTSRMVGMKKNKPKPEPKYADHRNAARTANHGSGETREAAERQRSQAPDQGAEGEQRAHNMMKDHNCCYYNCPEPGTIHIGPNGGDSRWICFRHLDRWNQNRAHFLADGGGCEMQELGELLEEE